jgi:dTMP kinase
MNGGYKYFCFEGPDYSGKSLLLSLVYERLDSLYIPLLKTKEPGSPYSPVCVRIRDLLQNVEINDEVVYAGLFDLDRRIHLREVVSPALETNKIVLSDRCIISSMCYQEKQVDQLRCENLDLFKSLKPFIFLVYADKDKLFSRSSLKQLCTFEVNIFNKRVDAILEKYNRIIDTFNCLIIDNSKDGDLESNVSLICGTILKLSGITEGD